MAFQDGFLVARDCKECPAAPPPCPVCATDEFCTVTNRNCETCADTICAKSSTVGGTTPSPPKETTNVGAIAGGVIGGVAFVAIMTFIFYWFCVRGKRKENEKQWSEHEFEKRTTVGTNRQARQSTRSVASTVLTRASNVIQIAYIPGVTNRSPPDTPAHLAPPVPPIPATPFNSARNSTLLSPNYPPQDQHFFMPGDIRDSTYSGMSGMSEMTDGQRNSITPSLARSSVATTIYRNNAIVSPMPAQQALRGKPAVVSVRSGTSTPVESPGQPPAVPMITQAQLNRAEALSPRSVSSPLTQSSIVARSVTARPINVKPPSQTKVPTLSELGPSSEHTYDRNPPNSPTNSPSQQSANNNSTFDDNSSDDDSIHSPQKKLGDPSTETIVRQSTAPTVIEDSPAPKQSPFADSQANEVSSGSSTALSSLNPASAAANPTHRHRSSLGSNRVLGDSVSDLAPDSNNGKRSSLGTEPSAVSGRSLSPFSDDNEVQKS